MKINVHFLLLTGMVAFNFNLAAQPVLFYPVPDSLCINYDVAFSYVVNDAASYTWSFGDGTTSTLPETASKKYTSTGTYAISLTITTAPNQFMLDTVKVLSTTGSWNSEFPFLDGNPDLFIKVKSDIGVEVYSSNVVWDCDLPCDVPVALLLTNGSYVFEIYDFDGLSGADELGYIPINNPTIPGTYMFGNTKISINPDDAEPTYTWNDSVFVINPYIIQIGDSLYINLDGVALSADIYIWHLNGAPIQNSNTPVWKPEQNGQYTVQILSGECNIMTEPFSYTVSAFEPKDNIGVDVSPNPASHDGFCEIQFRNQSQKISKIELQDLSGRIVYTIQNPIHSEAIINLAGIGIPAGVYCWNIQTESSPIPLKKKFVVF